MSKDDEPVWGDPVVKAIEEGAKKAGFRRLTKEEEKEMFKDIDKRVEEMKIDAAKRLAENPYTGKYQWRPGMREISGFGNGYEEMCRRMVARGLEWFDSNPHIEPEFTMFKNVYGIANARNEDAEVLDDVLLRAADELGGGSSGAQHQACISHILHARRVGWEQYCKEMSERKHENG